MSTSSTYVKWAAVTFDLAIFSKIRFRSPWIGIRCSAPPAATVTVGEGATTAVRGGPFHVRRGGRHDSARAPPRSSEADGGPQGSQADRSEERRVGKRVGGG